MAVFRMISFFININKRGSRNGSRVYEKQKTFKSLIKCSGFLFQVPLSALYSISANSSCVKMPLSLRQTLGENMQKQQFDLQSIRSCRSEILKGSLNNYLGDVRVCTLIPVEETFHIDRVTDLETFNCLVNRCVGTCEVRLDRE